MNMFKDTCMVVNHYIDGYDVDQYQETTLGGVYWERSRSIQAESGGYGNDSSVLVVIPKNIVGTGQYIAPKEFADLPSKIGYWTLQEGDKMRCQGEEITITSISYHPHGPMTHWEVGGV